MMPLRAATPNTVKNPTSEPSEMTPPVANAASTPPIRADGRVKKARAARRQLAEGCLQEEEDPERCGNAEAEQLPLGRLPLLVLPEDLCVVPERELDPLEALFDVAHYRAEIAPVRIEAHVNATRVVFAHYQVRGRQDADVGHISQAHLVTIGCVDEQLTDTGQAVARLGRSPHHYIGRSEQHTSELQSRQYLVCRLLLEKK